MAKVKLYKFDILRADNGDKIDTWREVGELDKLQKNLERYWAKRPVRVRIVCKNP